MANNRMWLVNDRLRLKVLLAKYYPSAGWYPPRDDSSALALAFDRDGEQSQEGPTDWRLIYDMDEGVDAEFLSNYETALWPR